MNRDFVEMLAALSAAGVEFLVVGAYALAAYGLPRATGDIDFWVRPTRENAERVMTALRLFGAPVFDLTLEDLVRTDTVFQIGIAPTRIDLLPPEDLMHSNSVVYIPEYAQIVVTVFNYSELWVIDHSTTTAQAATHAGGRYGHGGDLLYRWGNPSAYGHGEAKTFNLSGVHDANRAADQRRFVMFDNDNPDPTRDLPGGNSRLVVIEPPLRADGWYALGADGVYGPVEPVRDGVVTETIDLWSSTVGEQQPSFRITPYAQSFEGVRALR